MKQMWVMHTVKPGSASQRYWQQATAGMSLKTSLLGENKQTQKVTESTILLHDYTEHSPWSQKTAQRRLREGLMSGGK